MSGGSIPYVLVGFIAFLIILRVISLKLVLVDNDSIKKRGVDMEKIKEKTPKIVSSSILETVWAIGVGSITGQLVT